jgi:hypothetical protein
MKFYTPLLCCLLSAAVSLQAQTTGGTGGASGGTGSSSGGTRATGSGSTTSTTGGKTPQRPSFGVSSPAQTQPETTVPAPSSGTSGIQSPTINNGLNNGAITGPGSSGTSLDPTQPQLPQVGGPTSTGADQSDRFQSITRPTSRLQPDISIDRPGSTPAVPVVPTPGVTPPNGANANQGVPNINGTPGLTQSNLTTFGQTLTNGVIVDPSGANSGAVSGIGNTISETPADRAFSQHLRSVLNMNNGAAAQNAALSTQNLSTINISSHNGVVTLTGMANTPAERQLLENRLRTVPGVRAVNNQIRVSGNGVNGSTTVQPGQAAPPIPSATVR